MEAIRFLAAPFVMCLILIGMHCYLGLHVLARGVIFVDLSLAQVAAFGAGVALMLGFEHHSPAEYFISLSFTFLASILFAVARKHEKKIPQEALIGIVYAFASASLVIVLNSMAHGAEHIKEMLIGQLLWVTWEDVLKIFLIYSTVSLIHYVFRKKFMAASFEARTSGKSFLWDFLFYALFGVIITSSVSIAGVLQVFAYLIVPSVTAALFAKSIRSRLVFGWIFGFLMSVVSMSLSYALDLPAGAVTVVVFTVIPILLTLFR